MARSSVVRVQANKPDTGWSPEQSAALYNVPRWSDGYAGVGANGHLFMHPRRTEGAAIDLCALTDRLADQGLELPVLVRFTDILGDRVRALTGAFAEAAAELGYAGHYAAVYPIKTNQQAAVVAGLLRGKDAAGAAARIGLEAGSKPELAAVLGLAPVGAPIVCNGYKDRDYIRRALIGSLLGHRVHIVVEKLSELPLVLEASTALGIRPRLGLRVRLATRFTSTQQNTGGEKSKFGLTAPQVLEAVALLREAGQLEVLDLLHIHLGSQVANVGDIRRGIREAARFYVELRRMGVPLRCIDVGGGLGVDYEGARSRSFCSMNYSLHEYAHNILRTLQESCRAAQMPEPDVISESGRALTAHHAVLVTSVVDEERLPDSPAAAADEPEDDLVGEMDALRDRLAEEPLECLHDAAALLAEGRDRYVNGTLSLPARAGVESAYYALARAARPHLDPSVRAQREAAAGLAEQLAAKYFCNFSIFQSIPDAWAIDQVFPIVPLQRLDEAPELRVKLCDLTCDSDGKLEAYVDREGLMPTLALHARRPGERYLLGVFLVGAYQEILGDMHNLFGDTHAVNVVLDAQAPDGWRIADVEQGDTTADLLRYVHLDPRQLAAGYRRKLAAAGLAAAGLAPERAATLLTELEAGLSSYTYLG